MIITKHWINVLTSKLARIQILRGLSPIVSDARAVGVNDQLFSTTALSPFFGIAENAMNLLNVQAFYQYLVRGLILLMAVLLDNARSRAIRLA
jgi:predicted ABC-type sugar transport system permease subunit